MTGLTLYDSTTGEPVWPRDAKVPETPVADDEAGDVSFVYHPKAGRVLVKFVAAPGDNRLVAGVDVEPGDDLPDVHRAIRDQMAESDLHVVSPPSVAEHLNVYHYLADPPVATVDIPERLTDSEVPLEFVAPSAADAVALASLLRTRSPDSVIAIHGPGMDSGDITADAVIRVDIEADGVSYQVREERLLDRIQTEAPGGGDESDGAFEAEPESHLRIYDAASGRLEYDSDQHRDLPERVNEDAARTYREGVGLTYDPSAGRLTAVIEPRSAGLDTQYVAVYEHAETADIFDAFTTELANSVDALGVTFRVALGEDHVAYEAFRTAGTERPPGVSAAELSWLVQGEEPLDFAVPDGETALDLVRYLDREAGDRSLAISGTGRTAALADTDIVVYVDDAIDDVTPIWETADRAAEYRFATGLAETREAVGRIAARADDLTGTAGACQRLFARALSDAFARRGLAIQPTDETRLNQRRVQAAYRATFLVLAAGLVAATVTGSLPGDWSQEFALGPDLVGWLPGVAADGSVVVGAAMVVAASLAVLLAGVHLTLGRRLGVSVRREARTLARRTRSGTTVHLPTVRDDVHAVQESMDDLAALYREAPDLTPPGASVPDDFATFLERHLLSGTGMPDVRVVDRTVRRRAVFDALAKGAVAGAVMGVAVLGLLWVAVSTLSTYGTVALVGLAGVAGGVVLGVVGFGILTVGRRLSNARGSRRSSVWNR